MLEYVFRDFSFEAITILCEFPVSCIGSRKSCLECLPLYLIYQDKYDKKELSDVRRLSFKSSFDLISRADYVQNLTTS